MKFKFLTIKNLVFTIFCISMINKFCLVSYAGNSIDYVPTQPVAENTTEKESDKARKNRIKKNGANNSIEQVELLRIMTIDPNTPLSHFNKLKKNFNLFDFLRDYFNLNNHNKLCFQFAFNKGLFSYDQYDSFCIEKMASEFLVDEILGKYKKQYIGKNFNCCLGSGSIPIGGIFIDYPIYVKNNAAQERLQKLLKKEYYNVDAFEDHIDNIIGKLKKNDKYFEKKRKEILTKLKECLNFYNKKIEEMTNMSNKDYYKFGKTFLRSLITSAIDFSCCETEGLKNEICSNGELNSTFFAEEVEKILNNEKKVTTIGKQKIKDLLKKLNILKKTCLDYKAAFSDKNQKIYTINQKPVSFKSAVIICLDNMRKKPTRPVTYNNDEERYILKLDIKYDGF